MPTGRFLLADDNPEGWKGQIAPTVLRLLLGTGLVAAVLYAIRSIQLHHWVELAAVPGVYLGVLICLSWRWAPRYARAQVIVLLCYAGGTAMVARGAASGAGLPLLLTAVVLAGVLLTHRAALLWSTAVIATVFVGTALHGLRILPTATPTLLDVEWWLSRVMGFTAMVLAVYFSQQYLVRRWVRTLEDRSRDREALQRERIFTNAVLDSVPGLLYLYDTEGRPIRWNKKCVEITGYSDEELAETRQLAWFRGEDIERVAAAAQKAFTEGYAQIEANVLTKDGKAIPFDFTAVRLMIDGQPYITGIGLDMTDRKRAEQALRQSETFYRMLFESANDTIFIIKHGLFGDCNPMAEQVFGYSREQLIGHSPAEFSPPQQADGRDTWEAATEKMQAAAAGQPQCFSWTHRRADGSLLLTEISLNRLEACDEPTLLAIVRDVTERKKAEESLRQLSLAVQQSPVNVVITDPEGYVEYVNPRFSQLSGYTLAEVQGKTPRVLKSGHTSDEEYRVLWQTIKAGGEWSGEFLNKAKDGSFFWERAVITSIKDEAGRITHFLSIKEDITKQKEVEEKLQQMRLQLAHVARLSTLGEMAAELAHELNHPLYAILNYAKAARNVLAEGGEPDMDSLREWNQEIADIALSAAKVVKRLRSFARRGESPRVASRIEEIIKEALGLATIELRRAKVTVETSFAPGLPSVLVDRVQIQQVLVNLLSNAIDAMQSSPRERRQITIRVALTDGAVEVAVADRGAGLPPGRETSIFEPFVSTKVAGLGMGLSIVRTIIEAHGGRLWAEANPEGGAIFRFTLLLENGKQPDDV
jgi:PAS domain S-box-containing protein